MPPADLALPLQWTREEELMRSSLNKVCHVVARRNKSTDSDPVSEVHLGIEKKEKYYVRI